MLEVWFDLIWVCMSTTTTKGGGAQLGPIPECGYLLFGVLRYH